MKEELSSYIKYIATVLVTIVLSGTGFWMMMGRNYVTRDETVVAINEKTEPINRLLVHVTESIDNNTKAIFDLRLYLAKFDKIDELNLRLTNVDFELRNVREELIKRKSSLDKIDDLEKELREALNKTKELEEALNKIKRST